MKTLIPLLVFFCSNSIAQKIIESDSDSYFIRLETKASSAVFGQNNNLIFQVKYTFSNSNFEVFAYSLKNQKEFSFVGDSSIIIDMSNDTSIISYNGITDPQKHVCFAFGMNPPTATILSNNNIESIDFKMRSANIDKISTIKFDETSKIEIQKTFKLLLEWVELKKRFDANQATQVELDKFKNQNFKIFTKKEIRQDNRSRWGI